MFTTEIKTLQSELNHFGLDPNDWKLVKENPKLYRVESLSDENFVFLGRVFKKGTKTSWDHLSLIEI